MHRTMWTLAEGTDRKPENRAGGDTGTVLVQYSSGDVGGLLYPPWHRLIVCRNVQVKRAPA